MINKLVIIFGKLIKFSNSLVAPRSRTIDLARRELILNILLLGSIVLSFIATISASIGFIQATLTQKNEYLGTYLCILSVLACFIIGYILSKTGRSKYAAYILIIMYYLGAAIAALRWGIELPSSILLYSLLIVLSGILISSRVAFIVACFISLTIITTILLHKYGIIVPRITWRHELALLSDGVVYSSILFIIALVSWLFNREMERALDRARTSELALKKQKDQLEILVAERTQELKKLQVEKLMQLYRFAEFGKISSGLFHELVTPLNLISLNLQQLKKSNVEPQLKEKIDKSLERALLGTARIERYISAARKQIQTQDVLMDFSVKEEINQVIHMLKYKAMKSSIKLEFESAIEAHLYGNPLKFNQLITNIVSNGIDAYDKVQKTHRSVKIKMKQVKKILYITIQDWGCGIDPEIVSRIYEPLFTTKDFEKGTGIGLALCKDIVEKDFKGTITVKSRLKYGTVFTLKFAIRTGGKMNKSKHGNEKH